MESVLTHPLALILYVAIFTSVASYLVEKVIGPRSEKKLAKSQLSALKTSVELAFYNRDIVIYGKIDRKLSSITFTCYHKELLTRSTMKDAMADVVDLEQNSKYSLSYRKTLLKSNILVKARLK